MASLFLIRGCLCLPKLCALKVMRHKRLEEYQECVWEQALGHFRQRRIDSSMHRRYINQRRMCLLLLIQDFYKESEPIQIFIFNSMSLYHEPTVIQTLFPAFLVELLAAGTRPCHPQGAFGVRPSASSNHRHRTDCEKVRASVVPDSQVEVHGKDHSGSCQGRADTAAVGVSLAVS